MALRGFFGSEAEQSASRSTRITAAGIAVFALLLGLIVPIALDVETPVFATDPPAAPTSIVLDASAMTFAVGQSVTLTATTNTNVSPSASVIAIVDKSTGLTVKSCSTGTTCVLTTVPFRTGPARAYEARVGSLVSNEIALTRQAWSVTLASDKTTFSTGQSFTLTATANQNVGSTSNSYRIRIYDVTTGLAVKYCSSGLVCTFNSSFLTGGPHTYIADVAAYGDDTAAGTPPRIREPVRCSGE